MPGPIPQREDETVRRNKPDVPVTKIPVAGAVEIPELGIPNAHQMVTDMYESLKNSAQNRYYEPSDWQYARLTLHFVNKLVKTGKPSAMMLSSVNQMLTSLLMTEGDRRRVRMEIERNHDAPNAEVVQLSDLFRARLEAVPDQVPEGGSSTTANESG